MNRPQSNAIGSLLHRAARIARCFPVLPLLLAASIVSGCGGSSNIKVSTVSAIAMQGGATGSIVTGGQLTLSATVQNDSKGLGLDWSVACGATAVGACGTFTPTHTASGAITNFTAPAVVPASGVLILTASSTQNPSQTSSLTLKVTTTGIMVSVNPLSAIVVAGGVSAPAPPNSTQQFTATVMNDSANAGVTWTLTCGSTAAGACGALDSPTNPTVTFSSPAAVPTGNTVTLTAASVTDPSKTASVKITVTTSIGALTITISQAATTVGTGGTATFTANVINDPQNAGVTWTVTCSDAGACGAISPVATLSGASTVYTAPSAIPSNPIVTVTATSVTDPSYSQSATIQVTSQSGGGGISVNVTPMATTIGINGSATLIATVTNDSSNAGVAWSIACADGGGGCGSISPTDTASGASTTYMAPSVIPVGGTVTVTAASVTNPGITATSTITVSTSGPSPITVTVSPATATVQTSASTMLAATVAGDPSNLGVNWSVSCGSPGACGSVTPTSTASGANVLFTAPAAVPTGNTVTVTAASISNGTALATSTITIVAGGITVAVNPATASIAPSATLPLIATVAGDSANAGVAWTISCGATGVGACGAIAPTMTASGATATYTAPAAVPTGGMVTVTATSVTDGTRSASATITVSGGVAVSVAPVTANIATGATQSLTATVLNDASNGGVTWSVMCSATAAGACGSVNPTSTASGAATTYTAPATLSGSGPLSVTVVATSVADTTKSASATITVTSPTLSVAATASASSVATGGTIAFTATVANDPANGGVSWALSCGGTGAACGTITPTTASGAPATYTAPATVPTGGTVLVTATSVTDTAVSAPAITIRIIGSGGAPTVSVTPATSVLNTGDTTTLNANVVNDSTNAGVTWTLSCGSGAGAACGTLTTTTTTATYVAPAAVPPSGTVTVTATSIAAPAVSSVAKIAIEAQNGVPGPIAILVTPTLPSIVAGRSFSFSAAIYNDATEGGDQVKWSATCGAGDCGSFKPATTASTVATVYTAPATPPSGPVTIVATTATAGSASFDSTAANVLPVPSAVSVAIDNPSSTTSLITGGSLSLTASSVGDPSSVPLIDWSVRCGAKDCGKFTPTQTASGAGSTYNAPASIPAGGPLTVTLTAASDANPAVGAATLALAIVNNIGISITTQPAANLFAGQTTMAVATVTNDVATGGGVDWSIPAASCNDLNGNQVANCGSFSPSPHAASGSAVIYNAPASVPAVGITLNLAATATASNNPPYNVATANTHVITVNPVPAVSIANLDVPSTALNTGGKAVTLTATILNDSINISKQGATWTLSCGSSAAGACGTLGTPNPSPDSQTPPPGPGVSSDSTIQYTPPAAVPAGFNGVAGQVQITATTVATPAATQSAIVQIQAPPSSLLMGSYAFVLSGQDKFGVHYAAGAFVADGKGNISSGEEDVATTCVVAGNCPTLIPPNPGSPVPVSGTYTIGADGRGTITLNAAGLGASGVQTFKIAMTSQQHGFIAEFDGSATASGNIDRQSGDLTAPPFTGNYSFSMSALQIGSPHPGAVGGVMGLMGGQITADKSGNTELELDASGNSGLVFPDISTLAVLDSKARAGLGFARPPVTDKFGRGTLTLPSGDSSTNFAPYSSTYYIVGANQFDLIIFNTTTTGSIAEGTLVTTATIGSGSGYIQSATLPALSGNYVFYDASPNVAIPRSIAGFLSCDESGVLSGDIDVAISKILMGSRGLATATEKVAGACGKYSLSSQSFEQGNSFDSLGRAVFTDISDETLGKLNGLVAYETADEGLLLVENTDTNESGGGTDGLGVAMQQVSSVTASAFSGNYAANLQLYDPGISEGNFKNVDIVGQIVADGASALTGGSVDIDQYSSTGGALTPNAAVSGTFTEANPMDTDFTGRFTGTLTAGPETTNQIFYVVGDSAGTIFTLRATIPTTPNDGWGGTGILLPQQF